MKRPPPWTVALVLLVAPCFIGACGKPAPLISERDIPVSRTMEVDYDEHRLSTSGAVPLEDGQEQTVLSVSRASTARYIEARSSLGGSVVDGSFQGQLGLHQGWRGEFFPLMKEVYETTYPLPPGVLHLDRSPSGVLRDIGSGWMVRGRSDWFTGFLTKVIEVPSDGLYTFMVDSDDGTIGVLQDLTRGVNDLRVLWYDWYIRARTGHPTEVQDVRLDAGTYLLTVHYFEDRWKAGYHVSFFRQPSSDSSGR